MRASSAAHHEVAITSRLSGGDSRLLGSFRRGGGRGLGGGLGGRSGFLGGLGDHGSWFSRLLASRQSMTWIPGSAKTYPAQRRREQPRQGLPQERPQPGRARREPQLRRREPGWLAGLAWSDDLGKAPSDLLSTAAAAGAGAGSSVLAGSVAVVSAAGAVEAVASVLGSGLGPFFLKMPLSLAFRLLSASGAGGRVGQRSSGPSPLARVWRAARRPGETVGRPPKGGR